MLSEGCDKWFYFVKWSVIKYGTKDTALYSLGRNKEKIRHLHGKRVYTLIIAGE